MKEVEALSDAELRDELVARGVSCGPVTGTTRGVYEKKLHKLLNETKSASTPKVKPTPAAKATKTPKLTATTRGTRKTNRSESEDASDDEIVSPRVVTSKKSAKPVTSTPTKESVPPKERTPSPPPTSSRRSVGRPANAIIPGLTTTVAPVSTKTSEKKGMLFIGSPSGDHPGSTPPRAKSGIIRTPPRSTPTRTTTTISSSFLSPDSSFGSTPKFSMQSSFNKGRMVKDLGNTTDEDSDGGEESSRIVHNITTSGDHRSGLRKSLDYFMGNDLRAGAKPGSTYELRRGTTTTNVKRDPKTGRLSVKQKSIYSDISTILIIILSIFFLLLGIAYLLVSRPETVSNSLGVISTAAKDTVGFVYTYAIIPAVLVGIGVVVVALAYFAHKRYQDAKAREQTAFEELVEKIIDKVQTSSDEGEEYISVPHVRDIMFPAARRRAAEVARWEKAVEFINENESRIATECRVIRGHECQVWRWLPIKKTGWQGNAYPSTSKADSPQKSFSSNIPLEALTRCLKVRSVHEDRKGKHPMEPVNYNNLKLAIMEKIHPVRPIHMDFDKNSEDGVLYMKLASKEDAKDAFSSLHANWFNGHMIQVKYMRDTRYDERFPITRNV